MARKATIDVAVIIPDASPILTLARIGRLDLLATFNVPIKIVDQVHYEVTKSQNDPAGEVAAFFKRSGNRIEIVETSVGVGFQTRLARNPATPSRNLGEIAVDEYASLLNDTTGPSFVPLVLFEDPDVLSLRIARLKRVHLLYTTGWLAALSQEGILPDAKSAIDQVNASWRSPMIPYDRPARTRKLRSVWIGRSSRDG